MRLSNGRRNRLVLWKAIEALEDRALLATITVTDTNAGTGAGTLVAAILAADSGDTIVLPANAVINVNSQSFVNGGQSTGRTLLPVIDKTLTIEGNRATISAATDSNYGGRFFTIADTGNLVLNNVSLTGGRAIGGTGGGGLSGGGGGAGMGGAIYLNGAGARLTINNSTLFENRVFGGRGGWFNYHPFPQSSSFDVGSGGGGGTGGSGADPAGGNLRPSGGGGGAALGYVAGSFIPDSSGYVGESAGFEGVGGDGGINPGDR